MHIMDLTPQNTSYRNLLSVCSILKAAKQF